MSQLPDAPEAAPVEPQPHYIATPSGSLRFWRAGSGPHLVVLPGLLRSTAVAARTLAQAFPDWTLTVIELPGIGGSARVAPENPEQIAAVIDGALSALGIVSAALLAYDLCLPICTALAIRRRPRFLLVPQDATAAGEWVMRGVRPPPLDIREDGAHLIALWSHFRDLSMLEPSDPLRVARRGDDLPSPSDLDAAVVAAAVAPLRYAALWDCCVAAFRSPPDADGTMDAAGLSAHLAALAPRLPPALASAAVSPLASAPGDSDGIAISHHYLQTRAGRVHMRRAGRGMATAC